MSASLALAALAVLMSALAARELRGEFAEAASAGRGGLPPAFGSPQVPAKLARWAGSGDLSLQIARAGLAGRITPLALLGGRAAGGIAGLLLGSVLAPALPGRLAPALVAAAAGFGILAPQVLLERRARRRRDAVERALPDLLDLASVAVGTGRPAARFLAGLGASAEGPLGEELRMARAEIEAGAQPAAALRRAAERVPGAGLEAAVAAIERSGRYGSPLAAQLADQAAALRARRRRVTQEAAQRAAPKIQLVVALVLVPGVLLIVAAVMFANTDALLGP